MFVQDYESIALANASRSRSTSPAAPRTRAPATSQPHMYTPAPSRPVSRASQHDHDAPVPPKQTHSRLSTILNRLFHSSESAPQPLSVAVPDYASDGQGQMAPAGSARAGLL